VKLLPLVFVRPSELRCAEWSEFVPLARQAVALLRELQLVTGSGRYPFPSLRTAERVAR
jgi:hypothetical protein